LHSPRKRAGISSVPPVEADAPNVVWATDFQFDSTIDGKAKIASMLDEHTRVSLLHVVERSITGKRPVLELDKAFAASGGPPKVLRLDNGPEMVSQALQGFCQNKTGMVYMTQDRTQRPAPPLGAGLPDAGRVRCGLQAHPHRGALPHQLKTDPNQPDSTTGWSQ
jgi:transposase InsO family protein